MPFIVVYDANVLVGNTQRDLLVRIAQSGLTILGGGGYGHADPGCRIRPASPARHPACPPETASMLHRCRGNGINAPSMPFEDRARTGKSSTRTGKGGTGGTGCTSGTARPVLRARRASYEAVTSAVEDL